MPLMCFREGCDKTAQENSNYCADHQLDMGPPVLRSYEIGDTLSDRTLTDGGEEEEEEEE